MAKKSSASSALVKRTEKKKKPIKKNKKINYSDIPASTPSELKSAKRVGRPRSDKTKQLIAIRIDPKLLTKLRQLAKQQEKPYQTFIHELLEAASKKAS